MNARYRILVLAALFSCACQRATEPSSQTTVSSLAVGSPSNLSYSDADAIENQGRDSVPNVPTVTGTVLSYAITPALPLGLQLDTTTGVISGRPLRQSDRRLYTITASGGSGSTSATIALRVVPFRNALDPHQDGQASSLHLTGVLWGRLADVYDLDAATGIRRLQARNLVIGESIQSDGVDYEMTTQLVTGLVELTILHRLGTAEFEQAYEHLEQTLVSLPTVDPAGLPPFPMIARNAAIVVRLDDLVRADTVGSDTLRIHVGTPPETPIDLRVLVDANHGGYADTDGDGREEFQPTRVILEPATTSIDALAGYAGPVNPLGLPGSPSPNLANAVVRIPTLANPPALTHVLANFAGNGLSTTGNGPVDLASPTRDVLRGARSGGATAVTGDPFNGFLRDTDAPTIVGLQAGAVSNVAPFAPAGRGSFTLDFTFATPSCAHALRVGDVIRQPDRLYEVVVASAAPVGATASGARVRMTSGFSPATGSASVASRFDPIADAASAACFVRLTSVNAPPADGVQPDTAVVLQFSEAMDAASASTFDGIVITSASPALSAFDIVPSSFQPAVDLASVNVSPSLPLHHLSGTAEEYFVGVNGTPRGVRDLAGNSLLPASFTSAFRLDPAAATQDTDGFVLRFGSTDEILNDGLPELRGQFLHDLTEGVIRPRPVTHFAGIVDRTQAVPAQMQVFGGGINTPLTPFGAKLHAVWRYFDIGFALQDEQSHNVDIEGLAWAPKNGNVVSDAFTQFEIRLSTSRHLPDESLNPALLPSFPNSGLKSTFADNLLDAVQDPQRVVHPRARGYALNPGDRFTTLTGTVMMPFPMNREVPASQFEYYTWRDTSVLARGGASSPGAPTQIEANVLGTSPIGAYPAGFVPTIGLPLLMEFRCYPDAGALGLNAFDVSIAASSSPQPNFRAFSAGGITSGGVSVFRDPDLQTNAVGGFNPANGSPTPGVENAFYLGQMNLVTRVSRAHTIWFDLGGVATQFALPVLAPSAASQPPGTQVVLAFRGATAVTGPARNDAGSLDAYGDDAPGGASSSVTFLDNDAGWKSSPQPALVGARRVQMRVSFIANAETGARPEITALGLGWRR